MRICQHKKGYRGSNACRWHERCNQDRDFGMSGWQLIARLHQLRALAEE
jgi:hypothetical protein